ncbi:MAG: class I SAM-dependent methyltransferase [Hyphomicrobiaceae bacterium]|nr:class I SAM-dependent methyltransferase [Hyphomicrobiaceae bacterium]
MSEMTLRSDAERMDRHYRFQRYIYDATRTHYLIGRKHALRELKPGDGESVLEIGCGTAWNLVRAARRYPRAKLYGVDVSNAMLETARASLDRQGLGGRIMLRQGDATCFDAASTFGVAQFDRVLISYALSMIPCWREALEHVTTMIAPGGSLHIVDFGQCERLPVVLKQSLFAFLRHYAVTPRADLEERCREMASKHGLVLHFERLHRGYSDYAVLTRAPAAGDPEQ